jgi:hypothetical protein
MSQGIKLMKCSRVVLPAIGIVLIVLSWSLPAQWPFSTGLFRCTIGGADGGRAVSVWLLIAGAIWLGLGRPPLLPIALGILTIAWAAFERLADVRTGRATGWIRGVGGAIFFDWILATVFLLAR